VERLDRTEQPEIEQMAAARSPALVAAAGLDFPLIAKADIGWHGHGVRIDLSRRRRHFAAGLDCGRCATLFAGNL
jgi:hypothetical protein